MTADNPTPLQSMSLFCREGSSDKVYHLQLMKVAGGFIVYYQHGRRGSKLTPGKKPDHPVTLEEAKKVFAEIVALRKSHRYIEGDGSASYTFVDQDNESSGYLPQLPNPIDEEMALSLIEDDRWLMQEKENGVHQMIIRKGGTIRAANRNGLIVPVSKSIEEAVFSIRTKEDADFVLDGEDLGDKFSGFDILRAGGADIRNKPALDRFSVLNALLGSNPHAALRRVRTAFSRDAKRKLYADLKAEQAEGVVFKRVDAKYVPGRPSSMGDQLKLKFYAMCTLGVIAVNKKRSVQLGAWTPRGWHFVGNVTIPANHKVPNPLDLVEIRYLYRFPEGSLDQPTYLGLRKDKEAPDTLTTLKVKPRAGDDES